MSQRQSRKASLAKLSLATSTTAQLMAAVKVEASAESADAPSFRAEPAYSGGKIPGYTLSPPSKFDYVIDLVGMAAAKKPKANLDHKSSQRVGHVTEFHNDGRQVSLAGLFSAKTIHRDEVVDSAKSGYEWEGSIEAELGRQEFVKPKETVLVNGQTFTGPLLVFRKSTLNQIAFVSQGADQGNFVSVAAAAAGAKKMDEFDTFVVSCGADPENMTDEVRARLTKLYDLEQKGTPTTATVTKRQSMRDLADREEKENERVTAILSIGDRYMKNNPLAIASIRVAGEEAIESGVSANDFELNLIRKGRLDGSKASNSSGAALPEAKVIECALARAALLPNIEKHYSAQTMQAVDDAGMREFSLQQFLLQISHANGRSCRAGERITRGNIREVLEYVFPPVMARMAGFTTVALPNILGAVANKMLEQGYREEDQTWREFSRIKPVSNFYQQNHFRLLDSLEYEEVGPGGELRHGTLGEETYTSQAKTYGKMSGLTRQQIINDDLGAFDDIRIRLGRGGSKKFNNVWWTAFLNNSAFFTAGLTNYISGSTTNLGLDGVGLELGVTAFRKMTSPSADGTKRVGVTMRPSKLLVPPELEFISDRLYTSTNVNTGGSATATMVPNNNIHAGKYRPIVQNRLSDSAFTGYSTTAWYLFGDEMQPMLVTFLNGMENPVIESTDADFDTLGILFRGYHDWGTDKSEYLSGIKSKGAA